MLNRLHSLPHSPHTALFFLPLPRADGLCFTHYGVDCGMTELQYLILETYHEVKEIDSYQFYVTFQKQHRNYTLKEVEEEMSYLHGSEFLESAPNKFHTLRISNLGEDKFRVETEALNKRKRWKDENLFQNEKKTTPPILELNMLDDAIIRKRRELELFGNIKTQPLLPNDLPAQNPMYQPKAEHKAPVIWNAINSIWAFINSNIIASILGGLTVAYILYKITGH